MCMFLLSYPIEQFVTFEIVTNVTFTPTLKDADIVRINSQADDDFIRIFCAGKDNYIEN